MQKFVNLVDLIRSRQELSNEYLLTKIGVDTAENEPLKVPSASAARTAARASAGLGKKRSQISNRDH